MDDKDDNTSCWLILLRAPRISQRELRQLVDVHGDATRTLTALRRSTDLPVATRAWLDNPDQDSIAADRDWLAGKGHHLLGWDHPDYPPLLRDADDAPAALLVAGPPELLWHPQVAIVGSRDATPGGLKNARQIATDLVAAGFAITSGLADGIDGAAHAAALDRQGTTIAVLGTGPDRVYPAKHYGLAQRIREHGTLVSEFLPGTGARPGHFPRRNRIISGLSLGTLVIEAGLRSGSLITARTAGEQGRAVMALPGSIHNPQARGAHQLIRTGATLVEDATQVIDELAPLAARLGSQLRERLHAAGNVDQPRPSSLDDGDAALLQAMGHDPVGIDELAQRTGLTVAMLSSMLLRLELEEHVLAMRGGTYARAAGS